MKTRALSALVCACLSGGALATWQPRLSPPQNNNFRTASEAVRFYIPPDVPLERLQNLALEVDGIDVTSYIERDGDYALYHPLQPLSFGMHRVRLVEYAADGSIIELGYWQEEVRKSAAFRDASLQVQATLEASQRVADRNLSSPEPSRNQRTGTVVFDGHLADADWQANMKLPVIYQSDSPSNDVDVADFRFDWQRHGVTAVIGHHAVGADNMVMSGFNRRGVSLGYRDEQTGTAVGAFSVRGSSITGVKHGLGLGDRQDRIQGGQFTYYPVRGNDSLLQLSGTYLTGKAPEAGDGATGSTQSTGGHAWTFSADSLLLANRMRLRGEYAGSSYDFDGSGGGPAESGHALALLATYQPWSGKQMGGSIVDWVYGAEYRRVGTFFRSPADPGATADRRMGRLFSQLNWDQLAVSAQLAQETDNVDDLPGLPRQRTRMGTLDFSYNPEVAYNDQGMPQFGVLGQQSYTLTLARELRITSKGATATDFTDKKTNSIQAGASFSYDLWNWNLSHNWIQTFDDSRVGGTPTAESSVRNSTTLDAGFTFFDDYTLTPRITRDRERFGDKGYTQHGIDWGLDLDAILVPDKLTGHMGYSMNHSWVSDDSSNSRDEQLGMNLSWMVVPAKESTPGLTLSMDASYNHVTDKIDPTADSTNYQVFLKARVDWAGAY